MIFRQHESVVARPEGDKTLAFHQQTGRICILNATSLFIWEHCTGELSGEEIAGLLAERFEVPADDEKSTLVSLVTRHLNLLHKAQFIEPVPA